MPIFSPSLHLPHCDAVRRRMARLSSRSSLPLPSLALQRRCVLLHQARAGLRRATSKCNGCEIEWPNSRTRSRAFVHAPVGPHRRVGSLLVSRVQGVRRDARLGPPPVSGPAPKPVAGGGTDRGVSRASSEAAARSADDPSISRGPVVCHGGHERAGDHSPRPGTLQRPGSPRD